MRRFPTTRATRSLTRSSGRFAAGAWNCPPTLFLETTAPLSHLAGQGLIVGSPLLAPLLPGGLADVQRLSKLLEDPENVRLLIDRINEGGHGCSTPVIKWHVSDPGHHPVTDHL